ncbi:PREDICTED: uncharacterized protein LOC109587585 [Amphimedon queenslandica]|uniref:Death domain-containing protein n=1 Tax=Amphimedon queenslandica TaxID=400682 RepID=A0A1X7TIQ6_AMPQE|nr:PREDICTED: uncharacterized protein LOC109587585 [Amphimedon queenslandica]|eukprot:XP_019859374.1 PREDICTED: uncharacterized protein LOC109587585 [Amphimedon queenslandica]
MATDGDNSSLGIGDLHDVKTELKEFTTSDWRKFGSVAGLKYNTLNNIQENKTKVEDRFEECLACWLRRKDDVDSKGKPSWRRLVEILEELGERALADKISNRKGLTSPTTPGQGIFLPYKLKKEYKEMDDKLGDILVHFAKEVFRMKILNELKPKMLCRWRLSKKEIDDLKDECDLTILLRSHCFLWEFDALKKLTEDAKMTDITKNLTELEEKRNKMYKDIPAKDFAKTAIEYCGTTGSREVTFEVTWGIDETTLKDFKKFLQDAFSSQDIYMYIQLKTVHNSRLTFVCVIPHWLVDEMKDYVMKNGDLFESKGVVEITVDGTIVFSVKHSLEPHQLSLENEEKKKESLQQNEEEAEEKYMDQHYTQEDSRSRTFKSTAPPAAPYTGLVYHEKKEDQHLIISTAARHKDIKTEELQMLEKELQENISSTLSVQEHENISSKDQMTEVSETTKPSTGIKEAMIYSGLIYYEKNLVTFIAAKDLFLLQKYVQTEYPQAEIGQHVPFSFDPSSDYIELILDAPQDESFQGWTIEPDTIPCRLYRSDIDAFGGEDHCHPPSCHISIPDAVPTLKYSIRLVGMADPVKLKIHQSLGTVSIDPTTSSSSSNIVHDSTSVDLSSTGGASLSASVDIERVKKVINDVLETHYARYLNSLSSVNALADQLFKAKLIRNEVKDHPSMKAFITEFKANLNAKMTLSQVQEHCQKFLDSFSVIGGNDAHAAIALAKEWNELVGFDFSVQYF